MSQEEQNENTQPTPSVSTTNQTPIRENLSVWAFIGDDFENTITDKVIKKINEYSDNNNNIFYKKTEKYLLYAEYNKDSEPPHFFNIFNDKYIQGSNFILNNRDVAYKCIFLVKYETKENKYILAYPFSYGYSLLNKENCIQEFGIISLANMIDYKKITKLDKNDGTTNINVQSRKDKKASEIEAYNTSLKSITKKLGGKLDKDIIENDNLLKDISSTEGGMSLKFSLEINDDILLNKLPEKIISHYEKDNYKKIKDIDNLINSITVENKALAKQLDSELYNLIQNNHEILIAYDDEYVSFSFEINDKKKQLFTDNIFNKTFTNLDNFRDEIINHIKFHNESYFKDMLALKLTFNSEIKSSVRLNQLFDLTIDFKNKTYFRNSGKWKVYLDKYCSKVNNLFKKFTLSNNALDIQQYGFNNNHKNSKGKLSENEYNLQTYNNLNSKQNNRYHLFDCILAKINKSTSVEICDIYDEQNNIFYHLKRYRGTESLHYLFFQGASSELFMQYKTLDQKNKINQTFNKKTGKYINKENIKIYFGIIAKKELNDIPLKSKISFIENIKPLLIRYGEDNIKIFRIKDESTKKK